MHNRDNKFGAGLLFGIAAGATAGYLLSTKQNRIKTKLWMLKAKHEIRTRARQASNLTQEAFGDIVDSVTRDYQGVRGIAGEELTEFGNRLKRRWEEFKSDRGNRIDNSISDSGHGTEPTSDIEGRGY
jgi:hypothetical protein